VKRAAWSNPSPGSLALTRELATLSRKGRGEKKSRSRGAVFSRPSFATKPRKERRVGKGAKRRAHVLSFIRVGFACAQPPYKAPPNKAGKRSAERRIVQPISAQSAAARCLPTTRPPFGAHACGTRHQFHPMAQLQNRVSRRRLRNGGFARFALRTLPRLSTLRADRSLCRSTGAPKPPGCRLAKNPRAGTAPRLRCTSMPSGTAPCTKRGSAP
jgi:hypothetical protein